MRLEDMRSEFPKMPDQMRAMVEQEVTRQIKAAQFYRRKRIVRKSLIVGFVAVAVLGTTVFASVIYRMHSEANGKFGVDIRTEGKNTETTVQETIPAEILPVRLELSYLPEGMVETDASGKYSYPDAMNQGGISVCLYAMDTGDDQFAMSFEEVVAREDITVNGNSGVYMEFSKLFDEEISFNQRIYVAYTDVHYVMEMFAASDVSKEDALKVAEGIRLLPDSSKEDESYIRGCYWSEYLASLKASDTADGGVVTKLTATKSEMANTHAVGERFSVAETISGDNCEGLMANVSEVKILDNIQILDLTHADADVQRELKEETDDQGNLLACKRHYMKYGNGTDSLAEVVETEEVPQKLVYVTLEYSNAGETELTDVLFMCDLLKLEEVNGQMQIYEGKRPGPGDNWDKTQTNGIAHFMEMYYYDVHGGERGNNYIPNIKPGETVTVHVAWVVPEDELDYLYLNLSGGSYEFTQEALAVGYVDIRQ